MSEVQKPVEETSSTLPTTTEPTAPVESAPATTEPASDPITESTPAATTETPAPAKEETVGKDEAKVEATPASEGVLGYKAPGLIKSFRFSKKFFWFSDEAVEAKHLYGFINNEKSEVAHPTAAWATHTGKGLLFFAKRVEDKSTPVGIINLAEISDVTKDSFNEFHFKVGNHKHTFEAGTVAERSSWIVAIETKSEEAKAMKEEVVGSESYKSQLKKYVNPAAVVATSAPTTSTTETSTPKKSTEDKIKDVVKKDNDSGSDKEEKNRKDKSRSQSRKRGSIFGTLLGKKEEHDEKKEIKKEEKAEAKEEKKVEKEEAKEAAPAESTTTEPAVVPEVAAAAAVPAVAAEQKKPEETTDKTVTKPAEATPHKSKRNSIFGGLFQKKDVTSPTTEKTKDEAAPAVPAKDTETPIEPVAETAPQIEAPVDSGKPIEPESVTKPIDTPAPVAPKETSAPTETGTSPSKGGLMGFFKKAENLFEDKKEAKKEEKGEKKVEEPAAATPEPAGTEPSTTTPAATEPSTTTPPPALKEKRRTSLFGSLGTLKKKADKDTSDAEGTDGETKHKTTPTSPLPKLGGIFRKPSKAAKSTEKEATPAETETPAKPEPISKEGPTETAPMTNGDGPKESIGDVVPEAVNVGHSASPVQAAA